MAHDLATAPPRTAAPGARQAMLAGFLGWTLDAFDFFVLVFLVGTLAVQFRVAKAEIIGTIGVTLAMRPVGALIFGLLADRFGRRVPLITNILFYSIIEVACGFAPNFAVFFVLRALYGIGMGGEWGVGASLVMEAAPRRYRGVLSGLLQSGYSVGYFLAALAAAVVLPHWGWRAMFWIGGAPALLALYVRARVPESLAWQKSRAASTGAILRDLAGDWKHFAYLVLMMTLMMFLSHGTQDLYPDFLQSAHGLSSQVASSIAMLYNVGAVIGAVLFGMASERLGRRHGMMAALCLSLLVIPLWAFSPTAALLALGAFLMQVGVQGAWGIIPAHLNELSPPSTRGLLPGLAYQLGILIAAPTNSWEYALRAHFGYARAMAFFELIVIAGGLLVIGLGPEHKGRDFLAPSPAGD